MLFTTTIEVGLKVALLKPVVYGLVHNQSVADLVSDLAIKHNGLDRFKPLLARILSHYGNIDFEGFTIQGHSKTVWEEIKKIQNLRNGVLHRAEPVREEEAELARVVASMIIVVYLGSILERLNLKLGKGAVIEDDV